MPKTESRAISAEVAGLFDMIRAQAREYSELMNELRELAARNTRQSEQVQQDFIDLRRNTAAAVKRLEALAEEALRSIEEKAATINRVYNELSTIESTKNSILKIGSDLSARRNELHSLLKGSDARINKMVEEGFAGLENRIALQFKQIKDDLHTLDQRLIAMTDRQRREVQMIQDDIDDFKRKVTETRYIVDETTKIVENMISEAHQTIEGSVNLARIEVETMLKNVTLPDEHDRQTYYEAIARIEKANTNLREENRRLQQKLTLVQLIAIGCSIGAVLVSMIISFAY